jgi:peptidoglycan/LPS O-acetylase OafA/YrhL
MNTIEKTRNENAFDFLRLFAALTVVIQHSVEHLKLPFLWHEPGDGQWFGDGVPMFFIISGLLVYKSCENTFTHNKPLSQYFTNRYLRIAPGIYFYLMIAVISFFIFGVLTLGDLKSTSFIAWFMSTVLLIPVYHPGIFSDFGVGVVNGSLWTIPAEFSFYVVLPLLVFLARKTNFQIMIFVTLLFSVFNLMVLNHFNNLYGVNDPLWFKFYNVTFLPYLIFFGIGIFWSKIWKKLRHSRWIALTCLAMYFIVRFELVLDKNLFGSLFELVWAIPFSYALIWFGYNAPKFFNQITNKIGDLSYGVYIWHMMVVNYFLYFNVKESLQGFGGTVINILVLLLSMVCGYISWWVVEKNALKYKPYSSRETSESSKTISRKVV